MPLLQFLLLIIFFVLTTQQTNNVDELLSTSDNEFTSNSTDESLTEFPFTTRMFPIEVSNHSGLPSNIKLESENAEIPRPHTARAYNPRPVYVNAIQANQPIPLAEHDGISSSEHYHRDSNELVEERYNFGSYDFVRKRNNHEYRHRSKESSENLREYTSIERPNFPQIIRLNEAPTINGVQMAPWVPLNDASGDVIQQNWWIERADPANNDTIVTYGQMRRHKV